MKDWKEEAEKARKRAALYEFAEKVKKSSVGKRGKRKIEAEEAMLEGSNLDEKSKQKVRTIIEKERERERKKREKRKREKQELEDEVRRWRLQLSLFELVDNIECEERMKKKAKYEYDENTDLVRKLQ
ncbi:unnamed protein product [Cylicostephanus goldi]|uniref:Uncharacterized protein n=1 Tax=Cylicostephanus goldi TaxID=71465 RepID=A0A3P6S649_CYLGO|nr:unnamed protein product [Cylicostephanus goldi]